MLSNIGTIKIRLEDLFEEKCINCQERISQEDYNNENIQVWTSLDFGNKIDKQFVLISGEIEVEHHKCKLKKGKKIMDYKDSTYAKLIKHFVGSPNRERALKRLKNELESAKDAIKFYQDTVEDINKKISEIKPCKAKSTNDLVNKWENDDCEGCQ